MKIMTVFFLLFLNVWIINMYCQRIYVYYFMTVLHMLLHFHVLYFLSSVSQISFINFHNIFVSLLEFGSQSQ